MSIAIIQTHFTMMICLLTHSGDLIYDRRLNVKSNHVCVRIDYNRKRNGLEQQIADPNAQL